MRNILYIFFFIVSINALAQSQYTVVKEASASVANTYTAQVTGISSYGGSSYGNNIKLKFMQANTGPATIAINGLSAISLRKLSSGSLVVLESGDIVAGYIYDISYNGSQFIIHLPGSGGGGGGTAADISVDDSGFEVISGSTVQDALASADDALLKARGTEVLSGGAVTFTIGTTSFNVAATVGQIKDASGYYPINYAGASGITLTTPSAASTWVYIDNAGAIGQQTTEPTPAQFRSRLYLTRLATSASTLVAQERLINPAGQYVNLLRDYLNYLPSPKSGLDISGNADLSFQMAAGSIFEIGTNFTVDADNPNTVSFSAQNPVTFFFVNQSSSIASGQTLLDVTNYDVGGVQTAMTNNRFKVMTVYKFNSGNHIVQDGQNQYLTLDEAQTSISTRTFIENPSVRNGTRVGWIIIQKSATATNNTTTTRFVQDRGAFSTSTGTSGALIAANNLSDLQSASTARTNLGLTTLATTTPGTGVTTFLATPSWTNFQGMITGTSPYQLDLGYTPLNPANNLTDVSNAATALDNLGGFEKQAIFNEQTGDYTLTIADFENNTTLLMNSGTNRVVTLPTDATANIPLRHTMLGRRIGTASITFSAEVGATYSSPSGSNTDPGRYYLFAITKTAANTFLIDNGGPSLGTANQLFGVDNAGTGQEYKTVGEGLTSGSGSVTWGGSITSNRTITGAFNIGFGASPSSKLHVTGTGTGTGSLFRLSDSGNTTRLDVLDNGKATFTTATTGDALTDYVWNSTWTASANSQSHSFYEFNVNQVAGGFTGLTPTFFTIKSSTLNYLVASQNGGWVMDNFTIYNFGNSSATSILRNAGAAMSLRGGTSATTRMLQFTVSTASGVSTNNNVTWNFTGNIHNLGSAATRTLTATLEDWTLTSVNGSTITYTGHGITPTLSTGTSTLSYTHEDYNPTITAGTLTHYAKRIRSGSVAIGPNVPVSLLDVQGSMSNAVTSTSSSITLDATHYTVIVDTSGASRTITLPSASGILGRIYIIKKSTAANTLSIDPNGTETIDGSSTTVDITTQYAGIAIQSDGTNWIKISGL